MSVAQLRVHALTVDRGGCFHYRIRQPLAALRNLGHWTSWGAGIDAGTWERADVVIGQYLHYPATVEWWCAQAARRQRLFVWEADDDIWGVTSITGHGNAYDDSATVPRMEQAIRAAHLVTVTTPQLADQYRRFNDYVVVLPNSVPDWLPDHPMPAVEDAFTIGYSASPSHQEDLQWFAPTLAAVMRRTGARLRLYGPSSRPVGVPSAWAIETVPWARQVADYLRSLSMDIGIAPLAPMPFNHGKSGIKALEYLAIGVEPVVSDWPQYRDILGPVPELGTLCQTQAQWIDALWRAAGRRRGADADLVRERRQWARQWTQSKTIPLWENAYQAGLEEL